jgi:hypothetical protein
MDVQNMLSSLISKNGQIDTTVNGMSKALNIKLTNSQEDDERAYTQTLLNEYQDRIKQERDAPENTNTAKYNYYSHVYQNSDSQLVLLYNTDAEPLWNSLIQRKNEIMTQISESIYYLNSQNMFLESIQQGSLTPEFKEDLPVETDTAIRKAFFYKSSDATILFWTNIINCIIFAYGCVLLYAFRSNLLDPTVLLTITLTFASVFALESIFKLVYFIPSQIVGYLGWGYSQVEFSNWWYLWVPAALLGIYILFSSLV